MDHLYIIASGDLTLPLSAWAAIGGAIIAAISWLAKLAINALKDNQKIQREMHDEVVKLTREMATALSDSTSALREMAKSLDALAILIKNVNSDEEEK